LDVLKERPFAAAVAKLSKAVTSFQKAAGQADMSAEETNSEAEASWQTLSLARATLIEWHLANALVADDDTTRDDCKAQVEAMITSGVQEVDIHARLLVMARDVISHR